MYCGLSVIQCCKTLKYLLKRFLSLKINIKAFMQMLHPIIYKKLHVPKGFYVC